MENPMVSSVKTNPSLPASTTFVKFIPNPSPIIDACNKYFNVVFVGLGYGLPKTKTTAIPINKAIVGGR